MPRSESSGARPVRMNRPVAADRRSRQWSEKHQDNAAQHAAMRKFLLRTPSSLSDAPMSAASGGKIGYPNQVSVVKYVFSESSERAAIEHSSPILGLEIEAPIL